MATCGIKGARRTKAIFRSAKDEEGMLIDAVYFDETNQF